MSTPHSVGSQLEILSSPSDSAFLPAGTLSQSINQSINQSLKKGQAID